MIDKIYDKFKILNYDKHEVVLHKGHVLSSKIIVIIEGSLVNVKIQFKKFKSVTKEVVGERGSLMYEKELLSNSTET